ncbi:MAG: response regulator transcription factor [Candidatus Delongbacteria bacterium]|jgi:DNA-binding NarL/FixJ family response regulator|nr:response regulator transcription factor [Candidatus Delongbacteria bacterium]
MKKQINIIIVDDHDLVRDGIRSLLNESVEVNVVDEAGNYQELKKKLEIHTPDVILLDINLPETSGVEAVRLLKPEYPDVGFLMLSMFTNEEFVMNSVKAGARGYLPKNTTADELHEAIVAVYEGREYFSKSISEHVFLQMMRKTREDVSTSEKMQNLTEREIEVLKKVAEGMSNGDIADQLCISIRTVETHKSNVLRKLKLNNTVELVKYAIQHNLICLDT